jgi:hypothetical protein
MASEIAPSRADRPPVCRIDPARLEGPHSLLPVLSHTVPVVPVLIPEQSLESIDEPIYKLVIHRDNSHFAANLRPSDYRLQHA